MLRVNYTMSYKNKQQKCSSQNTEKCQDYKSNYSRVNTPRQYPLTPHWYVYNLWRDNCEAFHLSQLELFWVNKHNLFVLSSVSIVAIAFFLSHASTINVFISRLPLVLQRHSQGTQLSLQESKSSHTPFSALYFSLSFIYTFSFTSHLGLSLSLPINIDSNLTVCKSCLCFPQHILTQDREWDKR